MDGGPIQANSLCGDFEGPGEVIRSYLFNFFGDFFQASDISMITCDQPLLGRYVTLQVRQKIMIQQMVETKNTILYHVKLFSVKQ